MTVTELASDNSKNKRMAISNARAYTKVTLYGLVLKSLQQGASCLLTAQTAFFGML